GATLTPMFHLSCVRGALSCPTSSPTAACASNFSSTVGALLGPSQCDGGLAVLEDGGAAADASREADAEPAGAEGDASGRESPGEGGCGAGGGGAGSSVVSALALIVAFAARRRRRAPAE